MKFAILGAGAIGGYLGARLQRAGTDVTLIARGPHLEAMRAHGLRVIEGAEDFTVAPHCTDDLVAAHEADAVIITLKAHGMPAIAPRLASVLSASAVVVSAQNGLPWWYFQRHGGELEGLHLETVDPGGVVGKAIDPARVIGCIVYAAADLVSPGVIRHVEGGRFSLGELDGTSSERVEAISAALTNAGLKAPVTANIRQELWVKLLGNAVFNPISALTHAMLGEIAESAVTAPVVRGAMEEVVEVASRIGVEMPVSIDRRIKGAARVGAHKTSMLQDVESGRPMEIDALVGSVVELAGRLAVKVPYLQTLYACGKLLDDQRGTQPG